MNNREQFLYTMLITQTAVSVGFFFSRLIQGMPFYEALGRFVTAFFLGGAMTIIACILAEVVIIVIKHFKTRNN